MKIHAKRGNQLLDMVERCEWLYRWMAHMEDRWQCLTLGRVLRAEVHYRVGIRQYEGMAREHLLARLMVLRERAHRWVVREQQEMFRAVLVHQKRWDRSMVLQNLMAHRTRLLCCYPPPHPRTENRKGGGGRGITWVWWQQIKFNAAEIC